MKIRCVNSKGSKLIEGQIYDAITIIGDLKKVPPNNYSWEHVKLYNGDKYSGVSRFETLDGKSLDNIYIDEENHESYSKRFICKKNISQDELLNTWIKYINGNSSKYFVNDNYYKVKEINQAWYYGDDTSFRIKLIGFDNFWTNSNSFRLLTKEELRNLKIDVIDGKEIVTTNFTRKFDAISEEDKLKVIINALIKAREEFSKNSFKGLTIEEFIIKTDNKYGITSNDIEEFKKIKIPDLFK